MNISFRILTACALAVCSLTAMAQSNKALQLAPAGMKAEPIKVAKVKMSIQGGKVSYKLVGNWVPYQKGATIALQTSVAYDSYEWSDTTNISLVPGDNPNYVPNCASAGGRWWFGAAYIQGPRMDDLKVVPAAAGQLSTRSGVLFSNANVASGAGGQVVIWATAENFADLGNGLDPNDPLARVDYDGVAVGYGALSAGGWYSDVDTSATPGLGWQMPMDGSGALISVVGSDDGAGNITPNGQTFLWGLNPGNPTPTLSGDVWDDDNPMDGTFAPGELYDYTFGVCPDPLNNAFCFFYAAAAAETLAPTAEQIVFGTTNSGGNLASWAADDNNGRKVCRFFIPNAQIMTRMRLSYTTTKLAPTAISFNVKVSAHTPIVQLITLRVENKVTNLFVDTNVVLANIVDGSTYNGVPTGTLANYVGVAGAMRGEIEIKQTGITALSFPCTTFEFGQMVVSG